MRDERKEPREKEQGEPESHDYWHECERVHLTYDERRRQRQPWKEATKKRMLSYQTMAWSLVTCFAVTLRQRFRIAKVSPRYRPFP